MLAPRQAALLDNRFLELTQKGRPDTVLAGSPPESPMDQEEKAGGLKALDGMTMVAKKSTQCHPRFFPVRCCFPSTSKLAKKTLNETAIEFTLSRIKSNAKAAIVTAPKNIVARLRRKKDDDSHIDKPQQMKMIYESIPCS